MELEVIAGSEHDTGGISTRVKHFKNAKCVRVVVGTVTFTFRQDKKGLIISKVDSKNPLNEPLDILPLHTNKIKIN